MHFLLAVLVAVFAVLLALPEAQAAAGTLVCQDMNLPSLGNDTVPGIIPAAPKLLNPGQSGYTFLIDGATDDLVLIVQTAPGVGDQNSFTRKINFALSGQSITNVSSVNTPQGCSAKFTKFQLGSLPKDVSVSTSAADLTNSASGTTPACFFNHAFRMPWKTFRDTLGSCGFAISTANSLRTYKGRVFVTHEDFSSDLAAQATRPAATNFYDINLSVANDGTSNVTNNTGTEKPYNADFKVDELSYTKDNDGVVKASIAYSLSTNWPYQVQLPSTDAKTHLISDASAPNVSFAGLRLLDNNNYPRGAFSHNFMNNLDGTKQLNGSACNAAGQTCAFHAVLSFTWKPTVGFNDSCSLSSGANNFQLDFVLACAGLTNSLCGKRMRLSLALPLLGAFKIQGSTDFCAAPSTSFPLSWSKPFDVTSNSRKIGEAIEAKGTLRIEKQLSALAIYDFSVSRADLTGSWPLWTPALNSAKANTSIGDSTALGKSVVLFTQITPSDLGRTWDITTIFTPNIELRESPGTAPKDASDTPAYMIVHPHDVNKVLSFSAKLTLRLYSDVVQDNVAARRRRLMYRDASVPAVTPRAAPDVQVFTSPVSVVVNGDASSASGLSVGAIAGIAVGCVAGIAALGVVVAVLVKRRKAAMIGESQVATDAEDTKLGQA